MEKRLDIFLAEHSYFDSRQHSQHAIMQGYVSVNGQCVQNKSKMVTENDKIEIKKDLIKNEFKYVSRGGLKLEKAVLSFGIDFKNKIVLDVGASTGGFTDCVLSLGAKKVYALDVGSGQLNNKLKLDTRVVVMENCNFRESSKKDFADTIDIIVTDVSFISLNLLADNFKNVLKENGELITLIKPQFECGKEIADKFKGIVLDEKVHVEVLNSVINSFAKAGLIFKDVTFSPIKGGSGNIEYLTYFIKAEKTIPEAENNKEINLCVNNAFNSFK
ncbi:MAG: TlyA family RNA methyltransferase [Clostridia bacterium]|jgi:23S rRNA (cytidine1920-2'-O)/16S rRNA (cytidine1409-2'-O)-methyltransferase|nr:TlyA family RNA methyltransferase [Clostridia bacterium]MDD4275741.1 TlyA family RNA methyltransferase [Clostridia bacterium]